ncbi:MAG: hypothetical protein M1541_11105 [Acidobacteria bacterium]|nr:hypothetical protein [Acidobacteriota bacterium]
MNRIDDGPSGASERDAAENRRRGHAMFIILQIASSLCALNLAYAMQNPSTLPPREGSVADNGVQAAPQLRAREVEFATSKGQFHGVVLEGAFGRLDVDVIGPSVVRLYGPAPASPDHKSLLAENGPFPWGTGAYTYVVSRPVENSPFRRSKIPHPHKTAGSSSRQLGASQSLMASGTMPQRLSIEELNG